MTTEMRSIVLDDREVHAVLAGSRVLLRPVDPAIEEPDARACPIATPGERLYCAEAFATWETTCETDYTASDEGHVHGDHCRQVYVAYRATPRLGYRPVPDRAAITFLHATTPIERNSRLRGPWIEGDAMLAWAARRTLVVETIRAMPLWEVTDAQFFAQGITDSGGTRRTLWNERWGQITRPPWASTPLEGPCAWSRNPMVWVIAHAMAEIPRSP